MSSELTVHQPETSAIVPVSDVQAVRKSSPFKSHLFKLKPATLSINQPNTQVEGARKGHLRIVETGQEFQEMFAVLLQEPLEARSFYEGEPGSLNRTPENLVCFQRDVQRDDWGNETTGPDPDARIPQAYKCASCPKASWDTWRKTKSHADLPPCDLSFNVLLLDTKFKIPLRMYLRSKSKKAFEAGLQNFTRTFAMAHASGKNPEIFDIGFKLSTKQIMTGKLPSYVIHMSDFRLITPEERVEFGEFHRQFAEQASRRLSEPAHEPVVEAQGSIDEAVIGPSGITEGEITI